ncbi:SGNH/GDSL hydrolase family protein [Symbioplanes lichenis]|uniref:SGNH/GDSL hydrolase family protein n=1 Tax=Symbioplanes lichenis TaxID=1629072 RepID=UPI0027393669|nr:SGNH/GDSL hydrolase family protein [Actinoplanes lichenis]
MRRRSLLGLGGAVFLPLPRPSSRRARWVHTWVAMPQLTEPNNLPPAPFTGPDSVLVDTTIRQTVHTSIGGTRLRVRFSNAFGGAELPITAAAVALPAGGRAGVADVQPGTGRPLTFGGHLSTVVPAGAQVVSDPVDLPIAARANLTVTTYLAAGQQTLSLTSHPGSRTTSHLLAGDHHGATDLPGATPVDHWYLISGVEVRADARALVIVGDSLTDGRGSTTNGNDRWPDQLQPRLPGVAVLNQAAGGNRVLHDGLGPSVLARLDRDVLALGAVSRLLLFEGVNDIGTAPATDAAQQQVVADLIAAYRQVIVRAEARDIATIGATITPFGGNAGYDDPGGLRERSRQAVNHWIRRSGAFASVIDFDAAVRDPAEPRRLAPAYDTGDALHLNPAGYAALAAFCTGRLR